MARNNGETFRVPGPRGRLAVALKTPPDPKGCILLSHCFTCNKNYKLMVRLGRLLAERGYAAVRYDFSGLGASEGRFLDTTLSRYVDDLESVADWAGRHLDLPLIAAGHSMGGAVSILAASSSRRLKGVVTIGASSSTTGLLERFPQLKSQSSDPVEMTIGGKTYAVGPLFAKDLMTHSLPDSVARLTAPLLVLHGTQDKVVNVEEGLRLLSAASIPKSFFSIEGAGHLLDRPQDADVAAGVIAIWADHVLAQSHAGPQ